MFYGVSIVSVVIGCFWFDFVGLLMLVLLKLVFFLGWFGGLWMFLKLFCLFGCC